MQILILRIMLKLAGLMIFNNSFSHSYTEGKVNKMVAWEKCRKSFFRIACLVEKFLDNFSTDGFAGY